jgi:Uma2 family endonuclease
MATELPRSLVEINYHRAAQDYLHSLPLEHFMEATPQATQRKITVESLDLVHVYRPDVHTFNELLVQYPLAKPKGKRKIGQVVPDNMVVVYDGPIRAETSFDIPLQPVGPILMLEYVSKNTERKDYNDNMLKYEQDLKVPYYLLFYPDAQELTLYHLTGTRYHSVRPDEQCHFAIPEIELEVALLDGWVRYWFRGELLPLPPDLLRTVHELREQLQQRDQQLQQAEYRAQTERQRAEALAAEVEQLRQQLSRRGE